MDNNNKVNEEKLGSLFNNVVEQLTDIIKNGLEDPKTGVKVKAPASYFAVATQVLKQNNISCVEVAGSPLSNLKDAVLPFEFEMGDARMN